MPKGRKRLQLNIGDKFGRWTIVGPRFDVKAYDQEVAFWPCRCECLNERPVRQGNLVSGISKSCGCITKENCLINSEKNTKHGHSRGSSKTRELYSYTGARARCCNPKSSKYNIYGGAGIKMCQRWLDSFENFLADMGPRPEGKTLERINGSMGYEPGNCKWATPKEQALNSKNTILITFQGDTLCMNDWSKKTGIHKNTLLHRFHSGLTTEQILTMKPRKGVSFKSLCQ